MFRLSHRADGDQTGNCRRSGPEDRDDEHRQSTGSTHMHSLQLLLVDENRTLRVAVSVIKITPCGTSDEEM